jgi:hypothetical protein
MAQQTAVEWLYNDLFPKKLDRFSDDEWSKIIEAFEQAEEMFQQQIEAAYKMGDGEHDDKLAKQYYTQTYGNNTKNE